MTSSKQFSILLVDDDKFLLDMYVLKFTQAGASVHGSLSSAEAIKALRDGLQPDAILFDLIMPDGDGFSLLALLRREKLADQALKIALTNEMSADEKERALTLGADDYFVKATLIPSEVVEKTIAHLRKHGS